MNNQQIVRLRSLRVISSKGSKPPKATCQSGVVLIISLVMLLLLTLIGTTSMQSTSLEEKMVGNMRDQNTAFQRAEAALRAGEAATASSPGFSCAGTGGYYDSTTTTACAQLPYWQTVDWTNTNQTIAYSVDNMHYSYYIEQLDPVVNDTDILEAGVSLNSGLGAPPTLWYRITARGTGNSNNTVILLQSTYTR